MQKVGGKVRARSWRGKKKVHLQAPTRCEGKEVRQASGATWPERGGDRVAHLHILRRGKKRLENTT